MGNLDIFRSKMKTRLLRAAKQGDSLTLLHLLNQGVSPEIEDEEWMRPLHWAARRGGMAVASILVDFGANISVKDKGLYSPLQWACAVGDFDVVKLLLNNDAEFESGDDKEINPLMQAACGTPWDQASSVEIVARLVHQGADIHASDITGRTALCHAIAKGQSESFDLLVSLGADIRHYDKNGWSLLHHAAAYGRADILEFLLDEGLEVNELTWATTRPVTAFELARIEGHKHIQTILLSRGADPRYMESELKRKEQEEWHRISILNGRSLTLEGRGFFAGKELASLCLPSTVHPNVINMPTDRRLAPRKPQLLIGVKDRQKLLEAVEEGDIMRVLEQLDKGVSASVKDEAGVSALHWAAARGFRSITHVLLERSGEESASLISARDLCCGMTALHWAAIKGHEDIICILLKRGAGVDEVDFQMCTPLLLATKNGHYGVVKQLVEAGANVNLCNEESMSPLHAATLWRRGQTVRLMILEGANIHAVSKQRNRLFGRTPLQFAVTSDVMFESVKTLLHYGASPKETGEELNKLTPVHLAALHGSTKCLAVLLDYWPAGVAARARNGHTPLEVATAVEGIEACRLLHDHLENYDASKEKGKTPLLREIENLTPSLRTACLDVAVDFHKLTTHPTLLQDQQRGKKAAIPNKAAKTNLVSYRYTPLPSPRSIRLLKFVHFERRTNSIFAILETVPSIDDIAPPSLPTYHALSYTCGEPNEALQELGPFPSSDQSECDNSDDEAGGASSETAQIFIVEDRATLHSGPRSSSSSLGVISESLLQAARVQPIQKNLANFLSYLNQGAFRKRSGTLDAPVPVPETYLWVDALCINQADIEEKTRQIALMGEIYSNAERVVIWLGKNESNLNNFVWMHDTLLPALERIRQTKDDDKNTHMLLDRQPHNNDELWSRHTGQMPANRTWREAWSNYYRFFEQRRWFRRGWTMQEGCLGSDMIFCCGHTVMNGKAVYDLIDFATAELDLGSIDGTSFLRHLLGKSGWMFDSELEKDEDEDENTATEHARWALFRRVRMLLHLVRPKGVSLPVDKVYAIIGLAEHIRQQHEWIKKATDDDKAIGLFAAVLKPRASAVEVYTAMTSLIIQNTLGAADILSDVELDGWPKRMAGLPSWVPDFSRDAQNRTFDSYVKFNATRFNHIDYQYFQVEGITPFKDRTLSALGAEVDVVDSVHSVGGLSGEFTAANALQIIVFLHIFPNNCGEADIVEAVWRTMIADHGVSTTDYHPDADEWGEGFRAYIESEYRDDRWEISKDRRVWYKIEWHPPENMSPFKVTASTSKPEGTSTEELVNGYCRSALAYRFKERMLDCSRRRALVTTKNGYVGMCTQNVEEGDSIWLLGGGRVPYVLRPKELGGSDEKSFTLVGECYVHGIMCGELMTPDFFDLFQRILIV